MESAETVEDAGKVPVVGTAGFIGCVREHVKSDPHHQSLTWLDEKGREAERWSISDLWCRAATIAAALEVKWGVQPRDVVFLIYPPGLDFLAAFMACLMVNCVAMPQYPPNPHRLKVGLAKLQLLTEQNKPRLW